MKSTRIRKEKGITLIALIITIVVLMVLAAVAISSIQNDGIIGHAQNATDKYKQEQQSEQGMLDYYEELLSGTLVTVKDAQAKGEALSATENTNVYDEYGNKIVVPAGFKITEDADTVPEGIVIEDVTYTNTIGSQFVWIPVGKVNSSEGTKTINLGRYVFNSDGTINESLSVTNPKDQLKTTSTIYYSFTEALKGETVGNKQARDIEEFISSAKTKGGYYIGRYEARTNNTTGRAAKTDELTEMTTVKTNAVYNFVTQAQAAERSQLMYGDAKETNRTFSSDLINSYAWDTAIVFIQAFGDNDYSIQSSLNRGSLATTGTQGITDTTKHDKVCNIWDMASNCFEWSTETNSRGSYPCTHRGGYYTTKVTYHCEDRSSTATIGTSGESFTFRPVIYVEL